jgi:hypothetical protein
LDLWQCVKKIQLSQSVFTSSVTAGKTERGGIVTSRIEGATAPFAG